METPVEISRFLMWTDREIVTVQSEGVDVPESHLIPGLSEAVAKAGEYQVWISSLQDLIKITILVYQVGSSEALHNLPGEVVCDGVVDFYESAVTINTMTTGTQGRFVLPDGAGRYQVVVTTDGEIRRANMIELPRTALAWMAARLAGASRFQQLPDEQWALSSDVYPWPDEQWTVLPSGSPGGSTVVTVRSWS